MSTPSPVTDTTPGGRPLQPLDPQIRSIQPAGGVCMRIELAWGRVRRSLLRIFRRGYLRRMEATRQGDENVCPHPVLDPRDIKFYRNLGGYWWKPEDDPFTRRNRLPFIRVGLAEIIIFTLLFTASGVGLYFLYWPLVFIPALLELEILWFFRNPRRSAPHLPGQVLSPADGKVDVIEQLDHDPLIGGPAVRISIFLSVFNVHINRSPIRGLVFAIHYRPGKCTSATRPSSAEVNEQLEIQLEHIEAPHRVMKLTQITGAIARRIVCWTRPGDELERGEQYGMIKLGSRTELVIPREEGLNVRVKIGDKVCAGASILASYADPQQEA
jgi:phosphatidylserine decarboxylase